MSTWRMMHVHWCVCVCVCVCAVCLFLLWSNDPFQLSLHVMKKRSTWAHTWPCIMHIQHTQEYHYWSLYQLGSYQRSTVITNVRFHISTHLKVLSFTSSDWFRLHGQGFFQECVRGRTKVLRSYISMFWKGGHTMAKGRTNAPPPSPHVP